MSELTRVHNTICTTVPTESESELKTLIDSIRSVPKPPTLPNEDVYISMDDLEELNIVYSTDEAELPDRPDEHTAISADVTSDNDIHLHSFIEDEHFDELITTHQQMVAGTDGLNVGYIGAAFEVDMPFEEVLGCLEFLDITDGDERVETLNFVGNGLDTTIASYPTETILSVVEPEIEAIEGSMLEERVTETTEKAESHLTKVIL